MARQSGIYGVVKTWDRGEGHEHVDWVEEACCDDSQCLKRREWQYDDETELDVDGGDGVFPAASPARSSSRPPASGLASKANSPGPTSSS